MNLPRSLPIILATLSLLLPLAPAHASDHGGGGGGGGVSLNFTTNAGSGKKYVQFEMVLELAGPVVEQALAALRPKLQHEVLLMISEESTATLLSVEGKLKLQEKIRDAANRLIDETPKTGVKDVLFTRFLIQ